MFLYTIVVALQAFAQLSLCHSHFNNHSNAENQLEILYRDVVIIGGGSTGTYAAVQLKDQNFTVAVVEWKNELGGHAETFYSDQGVAVNLGVEVFHPDNCTYNYFNKLGVPLKPLQYGQGGETIYLDFNSGQPILDPLPDTNASNAALQTYMNLMNQYPYLRTGFDLQYPVPEDLLLPFGEFIEKHNIGAYLRPLYTYYEGMGDVLHEPTIYVMKNLDSLSIQESLSGKMLTTASENSQDLYISAAQYLGAENLFLQSSLLQVHRTTSHVEVLITTPSGPKLIHARKLLNTIPPLINNLQAFDLHSTEHALFSQFRYTGFWTGLVNSTRLPPATAFVNAGPNASSYHLPAAIGLYALDPVPSLPGVFTTKFGSPTLLTDAQVQSRILSEIAHVQQSQGVTVNATTTPPSFVAFKSHTPFELQVSAAAIREGFYEQLYALQGQWHTWYTGGAWHTYDSSFLWSFTDSVLARMVRELNNGTTMDD